MDNFLGGRVRLDQVRLEAVRAAVRSHISQEAMRSVNFEQYMVEEMDAIACTLSLLIYEQKLEPDMQVLEFEQQGCVASQDSFVLLTPIARVDHLLSLLPRWLRWRQPRTHALLARTPARSVPVMVKVKRKVMIERKLRYPDMSVALPPEKMGQPIYVEQLRHEPWLPR